MNELLRPNAGGTTTELTRWPGAAPPDPEVNFTLVNEETPDGASTMVYFGSSFYRLDTYNIPDHSVGPALITHVKVTCRMENSPSLGKVAIRTHDTVYYGDEEDLTGEWVAYSKQWDLNPDTGNAWTWDEIDALEIGVALKGVDGNSGRCTQVFVEVDYIIEKTSSDQGHGSDSLGAMIETPLQGDDLKLPPDIPGQVSLI